MAKARANRKASKAHAAIAMSLGIPKGFAPRAPRVRAKMEARAKGKTAAAKGMGATGAGALTMGSRGVGRPITWDPMMRGDPVTPGEVALAEQACLA